MAESDKPPSANDDRPARYGDAGAKEPRRRGGRARRGVQLVLAAVAVVLLAAAIGYAVGRMQSRGELQQVRDELRTAEQQRAETETALQQELEAEQRRAQLLQTYRLLQRTLDALDDRNFGIAEQRLQAAARLLSDVEPANERLRQLAEEMRQTQVLAATELEQQRERLEGFQRRLEPALPPLPDATSG